MVNGSDVALSLQVGTTTNYRTILYGTADNFQLASKDEDITTKQSGRYEEYQIVSHSATFDISWNYDGATSTTYYDPKALMDAELAGTALGVKFGKASGIGVTGSAILTGLSIDAPMNGIVKGKLSCKMTGTITPTATLA